MKLLPTTVKVAEIYQNQEIRKTIIGTLFIDFVSSGDASAFLDEKGHVDEELFIRGLFSGQIELSIKY